MQNYPACKELNKYQVAPVASSVCVTFPYVSCVDPEGGGGGGGPDPPTPEKSQKYTVS